MLQNIVLHVSLAVSSYTNSFARGETRALLPRFTPGSVCVTPTLSGRYIRPVLPAEIYLREESIVIAVQAA